MKRTACRLLAISSAALVVTMAQARTRPRYGGTLRAETQTVAMSGDYTPEVLVARVFETLTTIGDTGQVQPGLAISWKSSRNAMRWEFILRHGVKFSDGELCNSSMVDSSFSRISNLPWRIRATYDSIIFESDIPQPNLPALLALPQYAVYTITPDDRAIGTGPFLKESNGPTFTLKANDGYWGGRPFIDRLQLATSRPMRDQANDLSLDRADVIELPPEQLRRAEQNRLHLNVSRPSDTIFLVFDSPKPELRDLRLRQAISLAIDRAAIHDVIFQHQGEIASGLLPNWLSGYEFLFDSGRDLARARELRQQLGRIPPITIGYESGDTTGRLIAERIALNARDIGLNMQASASNAAPADLRLRRVSLPSLDPAAALNALIDRLGITAPANSSTTESLYETEHAALKTYNAIPLIHLPHVTVVSDRVRDWSASADGQWQADSIWLASHSLSGEAHP